MKIGKYLFYCGAIINLIICGVYLNTMDNSITRIKNKIAKIDYPIKGYKYSNLVTGTTKKPRPIIKPVSNTIIIDSTNHSKISEQQTLIANLRDSVSNLKKRLASNKVDKSESQYQTMFLTNSYKPYLIILKRDRSLKDKAEYNYRFINDSGVDIILGDSIQYQKFGNKLEIEFPFGQTLVNNEYVDLKLKNIHFDEPNMDSGDYQLLETITIPTKFINGVKNNDLRFNIHQTK